jgi:signal transduction histidine kinase
MDRIETCETVGSVLGHVFAFLSGQEYGLLYRTRYYEVATPSDPIQLRCRYHDPDIEPERPYVPGTDSIVIRRSDRGGELSFHALDHNCYLLATADPQDLEFFEETYQPERLSEKVYVANTELFRDLRLYLYASEDGPVKLFADDVLHCWLDIPVGPRGKHIGKLSITPRGLRGRFSREEMEHLWVFGTAVNAKVSSLLAFDRQRHHSLLAVSHELAQPSLLALTSIEYLRRKDEENRRTPQTDRFGYYVKKNLETAVRLVTFLNDYPLVSHDVPSYSTERAPTVLLSGVLAPVVNLVRHHEFSKALQRYKADITAEAIRDLELGGPAGGGSSSGKVSFTFERKYDIYYDQMLELVSVYVDRYRLQEVFYNLLMNAVKYVKQDASLHVQVECQRTWDFPDKEQQAYSKFFVIDIKDRGLGILPEEKTKIFELGVQGYAAKTREMQLGTGRGLFISREIILSVGGEIIVHQCQAPTTFRIFIPAVCQDAAWSQKLSQVRQDQHELREFLGDDAAPMPTV